MMRLEINHNLEPEELVKSLAALAHTEGITGPLMDRLSYIHECDDSCTHLHKAYTDGDDDKEPEAYMQELMEAWREVGQTLLNACAGNYVRWLGYKLPRIKKELKELIKSVGRPPRDSLMLTQDDIEELRTLIEQHFTPSVIDTELQTRERWQITPAMQQQWREAGIIAPSVNLLGIIDDAYTAGRLYQVLQEGHSLAHMMELARSMPLTRAERIAIQVCRNHAAENMTGFAATMANGVVQRTAERNRAIAHQVITMYQEKRLKVTRHTPRGIAELSPAEVASLESEQVAQNWRQLASELYHWFKEDPEEKGRDWQRVGVSESRWSLNWGRIQSMHLDQVEYIYFIVQPDACKYCKKLLLEEDGRTPRLFRTAEVMRTIIETDGMNRGRRASMIGTPEGWVVTALIHPWCRCRAERYLGGQVITMQNEGLIELVTPLNIPAA